jgi:hypothetical protein
MMLGLHTRHALALLIAARSDACRVCSLDLIPNHYCQGTTRASGNCCVLHRRNPSTKSAAVAFNFVLYVSNALSLCVVLLSSLRSLIDEMRSTVRCKANALFFDAHYTSPADMDFNW